jgi:SsrA-binding protein
VLEGWEVKAIRAGQVQLKEAYVIVRGGRSCCSTRTSRR